MGIRCVSQLSIAAGALALLACSADESGDGPRGNGSSQSGVQGSPSGGAGQGGGAGQSGSIFGNPNAGSGAPIGIAGTAAPGNGEICEIVNVSADPVTPDILIVLDRSGSMTDGGRWMPSVAALRRVTEELQSQVRFGLAMFPDPASSPVNVAIDFTQCFTAADPQACLDDLTANANRAVCAPGAMVVPVEIDNAPAIHQALDGTMPAGGTPTGETLQSLVGTFGAQETNPDAMPNPKFVLLVTDGQPTCPSGQGMNVTPADIDLSNSAIEALAAAGVRTYVIGYDTTGPGNEQLAAVLDGFAQRGNTGDTQHRPVEDEQSLLTELQRITGDVVSCTFVLEEAPPRPDFVLVRLDGHQINLGEADGWALDGDRTVQLMGASCEKLKDGAAHAVEVEVRCSVVTPE